MEPVIKVLGNLLKEGKVDFIKINLEQVEELIQKEYDRQEQEFFDAMKTPYTPPSFGTNFWSDWDSLIFWQSMNWRNFTLIRIAGETNIYSKYFELEIALLGFHLEISWYREHGEEISS